MGRKRNSAFETLHNNGGQVDSAYRVKLQGRTARLSDKAARKRAEGVQRASTEGA